MPSQSSAATGVQRGLVGNRFADKVALLTGGGGGMGRAIAERLHAEGARLVVVDLALERAEETVDQLSGGADAAVAVGADVADADDVARIGRRAEERFGRVDVLVNCAAIRSLETDDPITLSFDDWDRVLAVNVTGALRLAREVLPGMLSRASGSIVNVASAAAFVGGNGLGYGTSKHALIGLTRELAVLYGKRGVRVNAVCPGVTDTPMYRSFLDQAPPDARGFIEDAVKATPLGRVAQSDEIASAVAFVASDEASFMCGSAVLVDGGYTLV